MAGRKIRRREVIDVDAVEPHQRDEAVAAAIVVDLEQRIVAVLPQAEETQRADEGRRANFK